ncbi:MAG: amidohydrolase family protein [Saprospiraceae bacterium]
MYQKILAEQNGQTHTLPAYTVDVTGAEGYELRPERFVLQNGQIQQVLPETGTPDLYATAGFINCHLHWLMLGGISFPELVDTIQNRPEVVLEQALENAARSLRNGITSCCDKGAPTYVTRRIYEGIEAARSTGRLITKTQYSPYMLVVSNSFAEDWCVHVETEADLEWVKKEWAATGAKIVKMIPESNYFPEPPHFKWVFDHGLFDKARAYARENGLIFSIHGKGVESIETGIRARVDSIEHGLQATPDHLRQMQNLGIYLGPTLEGFECRINWAREHGKNLVMAEYEWEKSTSLVRTASTLNDGKPFPYVIFANDAGSFNTPHGTLRELYLLRQFGYSPEDVLRIATLNGAAFMRKQNHIGQLAPGFAADIIYWKKNPLALSLDEWANLTDHIAAVVSDGQLAHLN